MCVNGFIWLIFICGSDRDVVTFKSSFLGKKLFFSNSCPNEDNIQGRSYSNSNIDILDCCFIRSAHFSGEGGVIYVSEKLKVMNINKAVFHNCVCSSNGGAIFFNSSQAYMKMICASRCSASSFHFAHISAIQNNECDYLSMSYCAPTTNGMYSLRFMNGNQSFQSINSSINNAYQTSGVLFVSPLLFSNSHCTFSNNRVTTGICIHFSEVTGILSFTNVINNNSPQIYGVVRVYYGSVRFEYSVFDMNTNTLFSVVPGVFEVHHSFISHSGITSSSNNNSLIKHPTYMMHFFMTHICNADNPISIQKATFHRMSSSHRSFIVLLGFSIMVVCDE